MNISYFCNLHMWINTICSHANIAGSFRVSLVVVVHSIWGHGDRESFFGTFMIRWSNFLYWNWLENRIKNRPVIGWFGLNNELCVKMSKWCKMSKNQTFGWGWGSSQKINWHNEVHRCWHQFWLLIQRPVMLVKILFVLLFITLYCWFLRVSYFM